MPNKTAPKPRPHVIVVHAAGKLSYHYCETPEDEDKLIGQIIGRYETSHFLKNEKAIQQTHKQRLEKK